VLNKYALYIVIFFTLSSTVLLALKQDLRENESNQAISESLSIEEYTPIIIVMKEQYDTQLLYKQVKYMKKQNRRNYAVTTLKNHSDRTQKSIKKMIQQLELSGAVTDVKYNWIINTIGLKGDRKAVKLLAQHKDIERIEYDPSTLSIIEPVSSTRITDSAAERGVVWSLSQMRVPLVWDMGFYGEGVIIALIDTGVNYDHNDIKSSMWVHNDFPYHGYNFADDNYDTSDEIDHGTHCAGIIAGDGTSGNQTGVAPRSKVMSLKVSNAEGKSSSQIIFSAIQFAIDYDADIMNLSLGQSMASESIRAIWRGIMENILSVGIPVLVAAGNEGRELNMDKPVPYNIRTPGDCPPPWLHPDQAITGGISAAISVGAVNQNDGLAVFSSQGPVTWQNTDNYFDYPYDPGIGLIRPDICAPGVNVISLDNEYNSGYISKSGTSMAAPNSAGVVALMLSKEPELSPEEISRILELTATNLSDIKSNKFGSGRIDAYDAVIRVFGESPPHKAFRPYPADSEQPIPLTPKLSWFDGGGAMSYRLFLGTDNPPTNVIDAVELTQTFYQITEPLEHGLTYHWRIDAVNDCGTTEGEAWSFTTMFPVSIDFESNGFDSYDWGFDTTGQGSQSWFITDENAYSGKFSAQSGSIGHGSSTSMSLIINVLDDGVLSFYSKVSSEDQADYLQFYIGNQLIEQWSGERDWEYNQYFVTKGYHVFRWCYNKDVMFSSGSDAAWIDDIIFPPHHKHGILYKPYNLSVSLNGSLLDLSWTLEPNENVDPLMFSHLGFNVYLRKEDEVELSKLNSELITEANYQFEATEVGEHIFYVTAVYRKKGKIVESEYSDGFNVLVLPTPKAPTNVAIELDGYEAVITWDEVNENVFDTPIEVSYYFIYGSNLPHSNDSQQELIGYSEEPSFRVQIITSEDHYMGLPITYFYYVTAVYLPNSVGDEEVDFSTLIGKSKKEVEDCIHK